MVWDREAQKAAVLEHTDLLQWHSTMAMAPLPDGNILGGTTISAGTGGEAKATEAELYIFDMNTRTITWHAPLIPGTRHYTDLLPGTNGRVFGFADRQTFFVFDSATNTITHRQTLPEALGKTTSGQGPRVFVRSPDKRIFVLLSKGIAQLNPETLEITLLAESPVAISPGGAWLNGRIYFGHGSHLYSWQAPPPTPDKP